MPLPTLYLETTIPSYLVGRLSPNALVAGEQNYTRAWWSADAKNYHLFISVYVREELGKVDPERAAERLSMVTDLPVLTPSTLSDELADQLLSRGIVPKVAEVDARHIAICATNRIEYLATWNCRHINNPHLTRKIERLCSDFALVCPVICTPRQLLPHYPNER
jgi:hypothetical protein